VPVAGTTIYTAQAQGAIRNITRLGDEIVTGYLESQLLNLTPDQIEHAMDVLNSSFIYNNDGLCLGRAEYGLRAINEAMLGAAAPADGRAGYFATIKDPYHTAPAVHNAQLGWRVLDPLTSSSPQTLDEFAMAWLRRPGNAYLEDPAMHQTVAYHKELVHRFGGGLKEAWAIGQMIGRVDEDGVYKTRPLLRQVRSMWEAQEPRLPNRPSPEEQLTGPYTGVVMAIEVPSRT
jgi:hypothetical protein